MLAKTITLISPESYNYPASIQDARTHGGKAFAKPIAKPYCPTPESVLLTTVATTLCAKCCPVLFPLPYFPSLHPTPPQEVHFRKLPSSDCTYSVFQKESPIPFGGHENRLWGKITNQYRQHQLASLISSNSLMACSYSGGSAFSSDSRTSQKAWWTMCFTRLAKLQEGNELFLKISIIFPDYKRNVLTVGILENAEKKNKNGP